MNGLSSQLQYEAVEWLDAASAALHRSAWADALRLDGIDVLDAMCNPLFLNVLHWVREFEQVRIEPTSISKLKQTLIHFGYRAKMRWQDLQATHRSPHPLPSQVLMLPHLNSHLKQALPLASELKSLGVSTTFLMSRAKEFMRVRRVDPEAAFIGRAFPRELQEASRRAAQATAQLRYDPDVSLPPFLCGASQEFLVDQLRTAVAAHLPAVYVAAAVGKAAVEQLKPEALVVGNDVTLEGRTHCMMANARGILTVCPMHGIIAGSPLQGRHLAEAFLIYGERSRQELIQLGEDPQRLHVCGAIHLTQRVRQSGQTHPRVREFLQLKDDMPWVLLATSGPGHSVSLAHHSRIIEAAARLSAAMPDIRFAVKMHPKDRMEYYDAVRLKLPNSRLIVAPHDADPVLSDILNWLQGCRVVITGGSTVGLEALLMNVPVITVDFADELSGIDLIQFGASLHATDEGELANAVDRILYRRESLGELTAKSQAFLQDSFHAADGNPSRIAAETILQLQKARAHRASSVACVKPNC